MPEALQGPQQARRLAPALIVVGDDMVFRSDSQGGEDLAELLSSGQQALHRFFRPYDLAVFKVGWLGLLVFATPRKLPPINLLPNQYMISNTF